jgi:hypothetical protein
MTTFPQSVSSWQVEQVIEWLLNNDLGQCLDYVFENKIDGNRLLQLKTEELKLDPSVKAKLERELEKLKQQNQPTSYSPPSVYFLYSNFVSHF